MRRKTIKGQLAKRWTKAMWMKMRGARTMTNVKYATKLRGPERVSIQGSRVEERSKSMRSPTCHFEVGAPTVSEGVAGDASSQKKRETRKPIAYIGIGLWFPGGG